MLSFLNLAVFEPDPETFVTLLIRSFLFPPSVTSLVLHYMQIRVEETRKRQPPIVTSQGAIFLCNLNTLVFHGSYKYLVFHGIVSTEDVSYRTISFTANQLESQLGYAINNFLLCNSKYWILDEGI